MDDSYRDAHPGVEGGTPPLCEKCGGAKTARKAVNHKGERIILPDSGGAKLIFGYGCEVCEVPFRAEVELAVGYYLPPKGVIRDRDGKPFVVGLSRV